MPLWLTCMACSIVQAYWQITGNTITHQSTVNHFIIFFWTCTITTNVYGTCEFWLCISCVIVMDLSPAGLIMFKFMRFANFHNLQTRRIQFVMRVIVESGILYTVTATMVLVSWFLYNNTLLLIISAMVRKMLTVWNLLDAYMFQQNFQMAGIAFNLIIIRGVACPVGGTAEMTVTATTRLTTILYNE